jgi:hypothetical protein
VKGVTGLRTTPDVAVIYIYPLGNPAYEAAARRFVSTYAEFEGQRRHTLYVVLNGEGPAEAAVRLFDGLSAAFIRHDDTGWDIGAFQACAREIECDVMVCLGGNTYFRRAGWLDRMIAAVEEKGDGLYGSAASYTPTSHVRTAAFWCDPALIRAYDTPVRTYQDRYDFEHGPRSITRRAQESGLGCWVVTWDAISPEAEWRTPADIYWRGDQRNCLAYDRLHDVYDAEPPLRPFYGAFADGWGQEEHSGAFALGKTKAEWLAEIDLDELPGRDDGIPTDGWTVLFLAALKMFQEAPSDSRSVAEQETELFALLGRPDLAWLRIHVLDRVGLRDRELWPLGLSVSGVRYALGRGRTATVSERAVPLESPWVPRPGQRMPFLRRALLRMLQPFTERQSLIDGRAAVNLALLEDAIVGVKNQAL